MFGHGFVAVLLVSSLAATIHTRSVDDEARAFLISKESLFSQLSSACTEASYNYSVNLTEENAQTESRLCDTYEIVEQSTANEAAKRFETENIRDGKVRRAIRILSRGRSTKTDDELKEEHKIMSKQVAKFSTTKVCDPTLTDNQCEGGKSLVPLTPNLEDTLRYSRNETVLRRAWDRWHKATAALKDGFFHLAKRATEHMRRDGYQSATEYLLDAYEYDSSDFQDQLKKLHAQILPLYEDLHAYIRYRLSQKYGSIVALDQAIPTHLVGNMWAQEWQNIYDLVQPFDTTYREKLDVTSAMKERNWTVARMFKTGESFYRGLGFKPLPDTFWNKSMIEKPANREVVCHGTAYDIGHDDKRIRMCSAVSSDYLYAIHHEMGHVYYYIAYQDISVYFHNGANPGFHEAIGDTMALSASTVDYLKHLGLVESEYQPSEQDEMNNQMKMALEKVMFLPFGYIVDQWRWEVYDEKVDETTANERLWDLRLKFQGVKPPSPRAALDFDATSKFHVTAGIPYIRYFVARFLQFDFHNSLCQHTQHANDVQRCSIYGNKAAGSKLWNVLKEGESVSWPEALHRLTGRRKMSAEPMLKYFEKLAKWLRKENGRLGLCMGWGTHWQGVEGLNEPRC